MDNIKTMVMTLLTQFRETQRYIEALRYELEHPSTISEEDMIDVLTFGHGDYQVTPKGSISNKTLYIALNYRDKARQENERAKNEIAVHLAILEKQQERLLYYIGLMDERDSELIRMTYMDGLDNEQIATKLSVTVRTVRTRRAKAIDLLCELFAYTANLQPNAAPL
jgi:DNA-directed RNA polymerase specialized sigma24 family protein